MFFPRKTSAKNAQRQAFESTQKHLSIDQIKDDCLVLKDGSLRAVLMVSSINMDLRSEEEQESVIRSYQNALNSVEFPIQIVVQSRKVDLTSYLASLEDAATKQPPGLLKDQTNEYIKFLKEILVNVNVMDKRFFVIIPFFPNVVTEGSKGVLSFFGMGGQTTGPAQDSKNYTMNHEQLSQRVQIVASLLGSIGLKASNLPTEALIELFYACYNPETAGHEHIKNLNAIGAKYITMRDHVNQ